MSYDLGSGGGVPVIEGVPVGDWMHRVNTQIKARLPSEYLSYKTADWPIEGSVVQADGRVRKETFTLDLPRTIEKCSVMLFIGLLVFVLAACQRKR